MKVQTNREAVVFRAFDVTFTIESEAEARALYAIFNYSPNIDILPAGEDEDIREAIGHKYGDLGDSQYIARGVYYGHFYCSKKQD